MEQLIPAGNSYYHGVTVEVRQRFAQANRGLAASYRAVYTLSFLRDDGLVNTSDAVIAGNFAREMSRSVQDRRHRFALSATLDLPRYLGRLRVSPLLRIASGAPFNIGLGVDRNLDDVANDRPSFAGDLHALRWRKRGERLDLSTLNGFTLPTIGQTGNLPRNAAVGPAQFSFDVNVSREFKLSERVRLQPTIEFENVLNKTVFSFGSEFIDFNAFAPTAAAATRQEFIDSFLVPTRTTRPRQIKVGLRLDF